MSSGARSNSRSRTPRRAAAAEAAVALAAAVAESEKTDDDGKSKQVSLLTRLLTPRVWHVVVTLIVGGTVAAVELHRREHGVVNVWHALLAFFLILNSFIAVCEQHLHCGIAYIGRQSRIMIRRYGNNGREFEGAISWFATPLTRHNVLHKAWADMWTTYTLFDPCYASDETYGYWVDSGNGFFTLLPSLALLYNLTYPLDAFISPFYMALLSIIVFWTELYGTIIYFWSFLNRGLHRQNGVLNTIVFVGCTNGIWFVVPAIAIYLMLDVLKTNSFATFRN
jgi:hypothetical protein